MAGAPRAASRFGFRGFISITRTIARGVTAMVVGSGALFGGAGTWIINAMKGEGGGDDSRTECLERAAESSERDLEDSS